MKHTRTGRWRVPRGKARGRGLTEDSGCRWGIKSLLKVSRELRLLPTGFQWVRSLGEFDPPRRSRQASA